MANNTMAEQPAFISKQLEFAAHIRNPEKNPCPSDVEQRRMNIYSELFYNNVEGFMSNTFPVLRSLYNDEEWHTLIRDYFENHQAHTPLFPELPREFLKYLETKPEAASRYPFIQELAHYEWVELALAVSDKTIDPQQVNTDENLLDGIPVLSPLAWLLSYSYPVHKISADFIPEQPGDTATFIISYRDIDDEVRFMEVNPVTAHLVELIADNKDKTGRELLEHIASQLPQLDPQLIINGGQQALQELHDKNIIPGTRN